MSLERAKRRVDITSYIQSIKFNLILEKNVRLTLFTDFDRRVVFQDEIQFDALNIACNMNSSLF